MAIERVLLSVLAPDLPTRIDAVALDRKTVSLERLRHISDPEQGIPGRIQRTHDVAASLVFDVDAQRGCMPAKRFVVAPHRTQRVSDVVIDVRKQIRIISGLNQFKRLEERRKGKLNGAIAPLYRG